MKKTVIFVADHWCNKRNSRSGKIMKAVSNRWSTHTHAKTHTHKYGYIYKNTYVYKIHVISECKIQANCKMRVIAKICRMIYCALSNRMWVAWGITRP